MICGSKIHLKIKFNLAERCSENHFLACYQSRNNTALSSQPVTRGRVSAVRGVNVDGVIKTLLTRGLIQEAGTENESGAIFYKTTSFFLERLGISSLADLPPLAEHIPDLADLDAVLESVASGD